MQSTFDILAEPTRRAILTLLIDAEHSVGELEQALRLPQPTISKHLRVLRDAGFVEATVDAQRRLYRIKPEPLQELDAWLVPFRRFWSERIDALERHLETRAAAKAESRAKPVSSVSASPAPASSARATTKPSTKLSAQPSAKPSTRTSPR